MTYFRLIGKVEINNIAFENIEMRRGIGPRIYGLPRHQMIEILNSGDS